MASIHTVLGGTGGIGASVVHALRTRGEHVRVVSRSGRRPEVMTGEAGEVEAMASDLSTAEGVARAVAGAQVVYHCAQPEYTRWTEEFPALTAGIADACERAGARLVLADNLYMYEPVDGPLHEGSPTRPTSRKGRLRLAMADDLLARHEAGRLEVVLGRASDYYGPDGAGSTPGALLFGPLAKGKAARWMGRLDQPHTLHYLPDIGRALAALGRADGVTGRPWILPAAPARTGAEWIEAAYAAAGKEGRPKVMAPWQVQIAGVFVPMVRELNEITYQFTAPFVVDDSAFISQLGAGDWVTPVDVAMAATVHWGAAASSSSDGPSRRTLRVPSVAYRSSSGGSSPTRPSIDSRIRSA